MAALAAPTPPWIPEDDLLLKNAVEAGASLEALAKGAVRFSRKVTVRELRDRWHSLLYDADVSAEASARMIELEFSSYNNNNNGKSSASKEIGEFSVKRKIESVRRLYYTMRKKLCGGLRVDSPNFDFIGGPDGNECVGFGELHVVIPSIEGESLQKDDGDRLVDFGDCVRGEDMATHEMVENSSSFCAEGISSPTPRVPLWKTIEDVSAPEMPIGVSVNDKVRGEGETLVDDVVQSGGMLDAEANVDVLDSSAAITECNFADLSDALLNFQNEDEFMDVDEKDTIDRSCFDGFNLLLASSPNDVREPVVKEPQALVSDTNLEIHDGGCVAQLEVVAEGAVPVLGNQHSPIHSESNVPSTASAPNSWSAEHGDGQMLCVLNTEDPEIPCNNVTLPSKFASALCPTTSKENRYLSSSYTNQKDGQRELMLMKKENFGQSLNALAMVGPAMVPGNSASPKLVSCGVKCQSPLGTCPTSFYRHANNVDGEPIHCSSAQLTATPALSGVLKAESLHARDLSSPIETMLELEVDASTSNEEESGSDDDVPDFSDIEAMILEMDLCPDDSDSCVSKEVSKYQNDDAKRTIIRLEQCARSSMQRAMASRGALAVLYGRHLKHYIKATEVLLGRATEDIDVDIDLGREGPANKISRRQALIKMEGDGSFVLKNLGKSPIFLNGKEVATGRVASLKSSSLIEIRRLAFVFEMNSKSIRQYLAKAAKIHQDNKFKFQWSEGGIA